MSGTPPNYTGPTNTGPEEPPPPTPEDVARDAFLKKLNQYNPEFYGAGDMFKTESADLLKRSRGIDPLFAQVQEQLFGVIGNQEKSELAGASDLLSRQTGGMNTAGTLNELQRVLSGFGDRRTQLSSQLQMQGLQRSDSLRQEAFDTRERSLEAYGTGLTNETIPLQLLIAEMNARNAGNVPDNGDDGGLLNTVLCSLVAERGHMPRAWKAAACRYRKESDPALFTGYHVWAKHLAQAMHRHPALYWVIRPLVLAWAEDMFRRTSDGSRGPWRGRLITAVVEPFCLFLGKHILARDARRAW